MENQASSRDRRLSFDLLEKTVEMQEPLLLVGGTERL